MKVLLPLKMLNILNMHITECLMKRAVSDLANVQHMPGILSLHIVLKAPLLPMNAQLLQKMLLTLLEMGVVLEPDEPMAN